MSPATPETAGLREGLIERARHAARQEAAYRVESAHGTVRYEPGEPEKTLYGRLATALSAALAERDEARAEVAEIKADQDRLDFLDHCNARLNASYGTNYRWRLILNHNVNRLLLGGYDMGEPTGVDLHDSDGSNTALPSCRAAIDEAMKGIKAARTTLTHGAANAE